jgi:phospholipid/cholesterol/gamma-HCH transport system ATP-binding protein
VRGRQAGERATAENRRHKPCFALITHNIALARNVADYITVLWKGRVVESGPTEQMLQSDNQFIRQFLAGEARGPLSMD